ncbi:MAG: hypothetical protein A2Z34_01605 [Planctomycetes bacterium RBG_16_59_8]|nr:MAG: hypothetical protein A2Z34_01605 [Planctomycetes bacterium RBG_16_59_8]
MFVLCAFCIVLPLTVPADLWRLYPWRKVELDLTQMDENGLRGPRYGKVSVSYEFCVPNIENYKAEVKAIDRTVQITSGYSGRIGAGKHECLCVGYTRKDYRDVLMRLAELSYIKRIIECHFE